MTEPADETTSLLGGGVKAAAKVTSGDGKDRGPSRRTCLGQSHVRADWDNDGAFTASGVNPGALKGMVTTQEGLWGVIITMDVAALRTKTIEDGFDSVFTYVLYFFVFWSLISASINYSTRFNCVVRICRRHTCCHAAHMPA